MPSSVVPWFEYSAAQAEDLIAALLVRTVDGAQRIDGAGGDGGVDVRAPVDGGYHVYEIKSFYARLTAGQKRQIRQSLQTAVRCQAEMVGWTLVLPLDLSPAEERWFTGQLASQAEVPISWIGRTQLEAELSRHRDLLRAFAPGSTERRAMDLLASYQAEQAGLAQGMADAIPRLVSLKEHLDVVDPDWAFDVQMAGSNVDVRLQPKDADALRRRPIGVSLAIDSANDAVVAEAVEKFLKYGRPVAIPGENILAYAVDLPGNLNQVVAEGGLVSVALSQSDQDDSWRLSQRIEALRNGRVLDVLPVEWTERSAGPLGGAWLSGRDRSGFLELVLRVEPDRTVGGMDIRAPASDDVLPEDAAPVMRFLSILRCGDELRMSAPGIPQAVMRLTGPPSGDRETAAAGAIIAETLARIQRATGTRFPLPGGWTREDGEMLYFCDQLLTVGQVQWYWPGYAINLPALRLAKLLSESTIPRVSMTGESGDNPIISLMGGTVTIPGKIRCEVTDMVVMNPRQLRAELEAVSSLTMLPVPLGQDDRTRSMFYLVREPEADGVSSDLGPPSSTAAQ